MLEFALGCLYMSTGVGLIFAGGTVKKFKFEDFYKIREELGLQLRWLPLSVGLAAVIATFLWPVGLVRKLLKSKSE